MSPRNDINWHVLEWSSNILVSKIGERDEFGLSCYELLIIIRLFVSMWCLIIKRNIFSKHYTMHLVHLMQLNKNTQFICASRFSFEIWY